MQIKKLGENDFMMSSGKISYILTILGLDCIC